jgi:hypothetical protein
MIILKNTNAIKNLRKLFMNKRNRMKESTYSIMKNCQAMRMKRSTLKKSHCPNSEEAFMS